MLNNDYEPTSAKGTRSEIEKEDTPGLVAVGADMNSAFNVAEEIELVARIYYQAKSIGHPVLVDDFEMERVVEKFRSYGQQDEV